MIEPNRQGIIENFWLCNFTCAVSVADFGQTFSFFKYPGCPPWAQQQHASKVCPLFQNAVLEVSGPDTKGPLVKQLSNFHIYSAFIQFLTSLHHELSHPPNILWLDSSIWLPLSQSWKHSFSIWNTSLRVSNSWPYLVQIQNYISSFTSLNNLNLHLKRINSWTTKDSL